MTLLKMKIKHGSRGGWSLKSEGASVPMETYPTKQKAIEAAEQIASKEKANVVVVVERAAHKTTMHGGVTKKSSKPKQIPTSKFAFKNNPTRPASEKVRLLHDWAASHKPTPRKPLSNKAISRESIYGDDRA